MSGHEPSPLIPIEKKKFLCIEYPGYVKRVDRAIKTLGGESALNEAFSNNEQVQLRFRAKDIFSHAINGDFLDACKLLATVTRRVKKNKKTGEIIEDDDDAAWTTQILGTVVRTLRFRALADFQYIVPEDDKIRQLKEALDVGNVDVITNYKVPDDDQDFENLRNIPPPVFTTVEAPFGYGYKQNAPILRVRVRQPDGSFKIKLINRSKKEGLALTGIKYEDENIPSKSWHNLKEPDHDDQREAIQAVANLFRERPIWSRLALRQNLDVKYHKNLKLALTHCAYTFHTGPWRDCWVKYGLDPKSDPKYYIYQQLDSRRTGKEVNQSRVMPKRANPAEFRSSATAKPEIVEQVPNQHVFDGKTIPGTSSMYQICDITDPDFTPIIRNMKYIRSYSTKSSGFFYRCAFERLRKTVKKKYAELIDTGSATPLKNITSGLADEIAKEIAINEQDDEAEAEDDDIKCLTSADFEKAARNAMVAMDHGEGSSKRLQEVADDYIDQLESASKTMANDLEDDIDLDIDLDVIDTLEEFDDDEFEGTDDEEADSQQKVMDEDVKMRD